MRSSATLSAVFLAVLLLSRPAVAGEWFRGNTHTHTKAGSSDSKMPLPDAVKKYQELKYNFLVISDHDNFTPTAGKFNASKFITIDGEELSGKGTAKGNKNYAHVTAFNISSRLAPGDWQAEVGAVNKAGGLPILNHARWAKASAEDVNAINGVNHMEVQNGYVDNTTRANSSEKIWQAVLDNGKVMYGVGADDAHGLGKVGKAWTWAFADKLDAASIVNAYKEGHIFGSSGPKILGYSVSDKEMKVETDGAKIEFIGKGGKVLSKVDGKSGSYQFKGDEEYVRVAVSGGEGWAFGQPHFLGKSKGWSAGN